MLGLSYLVGGFSGFGFRRRPHHHRHHGSWIAVSVLKPSGGLQAPGPAADTPWPPSTWCLAGPCRTRGLARSWEGLGSTVAGLQSTSVRCTEALASACLKRTRASPGRQTAEWTWTLLPRPPAARALVVARLPHGAPRRPPDALPL